MYLIDSHCHLHDPEFFSTAASEAALGRAAAAGVQQIICIGTDPEDSLTAQRFSGQHPGVFWSFGVHPSEWQKWLTLSSSAKADFLSQAFSGSDSRPIAIGEVGLDYHYGNSDRAEQIRLFEEMIDIALRHQLPLIFHIREAFDDFFTIIQNFPTATGVIHSFTDNKKNLRRSLEHGFYIGVNGLATYSTLPTPPTERMLLETDAPFLTPEPFRGTINESAYIKEIAAFIATKLGVSRQEIAEQTTQNVHNLFQLPSTILCQP